MFRYKKAVPVRYALQGYIYFNSKMYRWLPADQRQQIEDLCVAAGGEHASALLEFVTTDTGATTVCRKHYISASTLERAVRRYYVMFAQKVKS